MHLTTNDENSLDGKRNKYILVMAVVDANKRLSNVYTKIILRYFDYVMKGSDLVILVEIRWTLTNKKGCFPIKRTN